MAETLVVTPVWRSYAEESTPPHLNRSTRSAGDIEKERSIDETLLFIPFWIRYAEEEAPPSSPNSNTRSAREAEEHGLSAFGETIPPSKVEIMANANEIPNYPHGDADPKTIQTYESASWEYSRQVIFQLVESADATNLKSIVAQLFAENIVRCRGFFATACMRCQSKNPHLTLVYTALAGLVNTYFPTIGDILYRRLSFNFKQMFTQKYDEESMNATIKFLSHLINLDIVSENASIKLLLRCLEKVTFKRVKLVVTFFKELRLPGYAPLFRGVHERFKRISKTKRVKGKKEILDMVELVLAEENWKYVFKEGPVVSPELLWVMSKLRSRSSHYENKRPPTNPDIFLDDYKPDKYFLKRKRAYYLLRSIILREDYWNFNSSIPLKKHKYFSFYNEVDSKLRWDRSAIVFDQILPIIRPEDEVEFFLSIFKFSCLERKPLSLIPVIEYLFKIEKRYMEILEICFLVIWLMVAGSAQ